MRVAVDARALLAGRGVARYTDRLLAALAAAHPADEWHAFVPGRAPVTAPAGVILHRHPLPGRALFAAAALARRPRIDALCGGGADVVWLPAPAPVAPGRAPYVLTVHDRSWARRPGDFTAYERLWHRLARPDALARGAAAVVAVSNAAAEGWDVPATVIASGADHLPEAEPAPGRYLLAVGALEPRKAPATLARAYARARAAGLDAELWLAGEGRERPAGEGIRLLGAVDDGRLASLYAGALALVSASHLEGFGLPPLEAARSGTPSILADLPVYAETLGDAALRVPAGDEAALAAALLRAPSLRAELGERARAAAAPFTWARAAERTHAVLATAAG